MKIAKTIGIISSLAVVAGAPVRGYVPETTVPASAGCPAVDRWNVASGPIHRRWSTSLPSPPTVLTVAAAGSAQQLDEIEQTILGSFGAWTGVSGTIVNSNSAPNALASLQRITDANACTNDSGTNADGQNTICFNQSSTAFTSGVLAFTRVITADAPGVAVGNSAPSQFAGQILDADTLFRNDGQATFATPGELGSQPGAYDLESLLTHELGHFFGLDHSAVWRAILFPFAPPSGTFFGDRATLQQTDAQLADDDRTGLRFLYPDPSDTENVGSLSGRVLPANRFALAAIPPAGPRQFVTGIFGAHVVAADADTGTVVAATLGGWSCDPSSAEVQFDGSYRMERLPVGRNYMIYAEPVNGVVAPGAFSDALANLCPASGTGACSPPGVNTNFTPRTRPPEP